MIIADTSIWVDHLGRRRDGELARLLDDEEVLGHAFVTAEIALGSLSDAVRTVALLDSIPQSAIASPQELMLFIRRERLGGCGIGFVDAHLLAACRLMDARLWTRDKRLAAQAHRLGCAWAPA